MPHAPTAWRGPVAVAGALLAALAAAGAGGPGGDRAAGAVVLRAGFESPSAWSSRLPRGNERTSARAAIVAAPGRRGRALRVTYPAGDYGGSAGVVFALPLPRGRADLHLRYLVRPERRFDFVLAGKLPGLAGGDANAGGDIPDGRDGWSGRLQWLRGGRVENYMYLPTSERFGTPFRWAGARLARGRWNCLEMRYRLNRPHRADGRIQSWLDGRRVLDRGGLRFRDTGSLHIDQVLFSTFYGGGDDGYAPRRRQVAWFDDIVVSTGRIGCPR